MAVLEQLESWPAEGQGRMKELLHPELPLTDQEKVVMTMELMDDVAQELERHQRHSQRWTDRLGTSSSPESLSSSSSSSPESERITLRMSMLHQQLLALQKAILK